MPRTIRTVEPHIGPIRWGIAATGRIAREFTEAFRAVSADDDASIVAVGSRSQSTADAFAAAHDIGRAHGSYADLAADPDVDVVYVASLQPGHMRDAITMLEAGKHVLVEKPFTLSAADADRVFDAARANDRFAMEAMWMRFSPAPVDAVRRIHAGEIGPVERMDIDFSITVADNPDHRLRSLEKGGGSLLDLGIYPLTLAWWIAGPPASWTVTGTVNGGVDTTCVIEAEWDGLTARLSSGLDDTGPVAATIRVRDATSSSDCRCSWPCASRSVVSAVRIRAKFCTASNPTIAVSSGTKIVSTESMVHDGTSSSIEVADVNRPSSVQPPATATDTARHQRNSWAST